MYNPFYHSSITLRNTRARNVSVDANMRTVRKSYQSALSLLMKKQDEKKYGFFISYLKSHF